MLTSPRARPGGTALACLLLVGACNGAPQENQSGPAEPDGAAASPDAGVGCPPLPSAMSGSPSTIADAVALANGLLAGSSSVSIDCFLSVLSRPLSVVGDISTFSLQPSTGGALNPRIFIFTGNLVMSVVPSGQGSPFVELAENTTPVRSIKAQLEFPVTAPITAAAPYDSVRSGSGTVCGACHGSEQVAPQVTVTEAFESDVLQPVSSDVVSLEQMQNDTETCDPQQEPERCAILNALFAHGQVVTGAFSPDAKTIFQ